MTAGFILGYTAFSAEIGGWDAPLGSFEAGKKKFVTPVLDARQTGAKYWEGEQAQGWNFPCLLPLKNTDGCRGSSS